jgi:hypothetical protein
MGGKGRTAADRSMGAAIMPTDFLCCLCVKSQLERYCRELLLQRLKV